MESKGNNRNFYYIIVTLFLLILFRGAFSIVACDDAFITFRYSENIASSKGFVYNDGERILGTSTPLFTLILALFRTVGFDIVISSHILSLFFHFAVSLFLLLILKDMGHYLAGIVAAFAFGLDRLVMTAYGMETTLFIFLYLSSFYFLMKRRILLSAFLGALMTFCRADGAIWLLIYFIIILLKHRSDLIKSIIVVFIVLVPWFSFSQFYFGSLLPHTVSVKILNVSFLYNSFFSAIPFYLKEFYSYFFILGIIGILISLMDSEKQN